MQFFKEFIFSHKHAVTLHIKTEIIEINAPKGILKITILLG
jgi:hypothetical protein